MIAVIPTGPDWYAFAVRVPERAVETIPDVVARLEGRAAEMGRAARQAWVEHFSDAATVGSLLRWARAILRNPYRPPTALRIAEYLHPQRLREKWRAKVW